MNVNLTHQAMLQKNIRDSLISEEADSGLTLRVALMKSVIQHFSNSIKEPLVSQAVAKIWTLLQSDDYNQAELNKIFDAVFDCKENQEKSALTSKILDKFEAGCEDALKELDEIEKRRASVEKDLNELRAINAPMMEQLEKYKELEKIDAQMEKLGEVISTAKKIASLQIDEKSAFIKKSEVSFNTSLKLIALLGKKSLNTPLFELLGENPPHDSTPEKRVLQAIKVYQSASRFYFNFLSSSNKDISETLERSKLSLNENSYSINKNFVTDFIKVNNDGILLNENLKKNLIIIENSITPNLLDVPFSSKIDPILMDDFTYLKLKNVNKIYSKLKESLNNIIIDLSCRIRDKARDFSNKYGKNTKSKDALVESQNQMKKSIYLQSIDVKLQSLFDEYRKLRGGKTDAEMHQEITEALLGDEFKNEEKKWQKISLKSNKNKTNITPAKVSLPTPKKEVKSVDQIILFPMEQQVEKVSSEKELLSKNSLLVHNLSKDLKTRLQKSSHVKELKDHLQFASLNFDLFCKAILKQDLYALGAIIPFFCLDLHLVNEQYIKHQMGAQGFGKSHSHNLLTLCSESNYGMDPELKGFLRDFSDAMLQVRYPVEKSAKFRDESLPGPLKWVLYSKNPCLSAGDIKQEDLLSLCSFVFNSYQQTLKHISGKDLNCGLDDLKTLLNNAILKFQNKKVQAKPPSAVMKTREKLLQLGKQLLQECALEDREAAQIALEEAAHHLITIDAVDYLQEHYGQLQFGALHHRNAWAFQWPIEKIYAFFGITKGMGDLRYLSQDQLTANHDLAVFHAFTSSTKAIPPALEKFNLGRWLYYNRENPDIFKDLLTIRKTLKKLDPEDPEFVFGKIPETFAEEIKKNLLEILKMGKVSLEQVVLLGQK